ncbi:MAG TPA: hypothetical protein VF660_02350 [Actinomycetota bacterium]|jgi:protein-tyrosine phosphatase
MATILLLCTGNICRSPIAEGLLKRQLEDGGVTGVTVHSAGVSGLDGYPADPEAVRTSAEQGVDISSHRARRVTAKMIESADLILTMTADQRKKATRLARAASDRTFTLKEIVFLLDRRPGARNGDFDERLRQAVKDAHNVRESEPGLELLDEDVSDPLGLGPDAFRAVVWEVGQLVERFVDGTFLAEERESVADHRGREK